MGRILAIDYGTKRTGIAVTDPLKIIASGLTTVQTDTLFEFLKSYCETEDVECFVVGLPMYPDGNPAQIAGLADSFAEKLQQEYPLKKVARQDERYSSVEAQRIILNSGLKKNQRRNKALVDKIAAAIILEQFMQENFW